MTQIMLKYPDGSPTSGNVEGFCADEMGVIDERQTIRSLQAKVDRLNADNLRLIYDHKMALQQERTNVRNWQAELLKAQDKIYNLQDRLLKLRMPKNDQA